MNFHRFSEILVYVVFLPLGGFGGWGVASFLGIPLLVGTAVGIGIMGLIVVHSRLAGRASILIPEGKVPIMTREESVSSVENAEFLGLGDQLKRLQALLLGKRVSRLEIEERWAQGPCLSFSIRGPVLIATTADAEEIAILPYCDPGVGPWAVIPESTKPISAKAS